MHTHRKAIARLALPIALATAGISSAPIATADTGQPQQGGGCHMVTSHPPGATGLTQMMAHSSPIAANNMAAMLSKFSPDPFCA